MGNKKPGAILLVVLLVGGIALANQLGFDTSGLVAALQGNTTSEQSQPSRQEPSQTSRPQASTPAPADDVQVARSRRQVCGHNIDIETQAEVSLERWGQRLGVRDTEAFANVLQYVNENGALPDCYLTKSEAGNWGWTPGSDLWDVAEGMAIGGNRFGNYEQRLPQNYNGRYIEADLDFQGKRRGAKRLIFVKGATDDWLMWVTMDHYDSFQRVQP